MSHEPVSIPEEVTASLREVTASLYKALQAYEACEGILHEYWRDYNVPDSKRWLPWSITNELRYAGQHICRLFCIKDEDKRQVEIGKVSGHCERAEYDAHDYVILCFTRLTLKLLETMEEYAIQDGSIFECHQFKKEFCKVCNAIAGNNRKSSRFTEVRREHTTCLIELFRRLMGKHNSRQTTEGVSEYELSVVTTSQPTPEKLREVFNVAEAYLKKYELVSGEASILGINNLFEATRSLADNDCQAFMERCYFAQINVLMEIVAYYFRKKLWKEYKRQGIIEELKGKEADEMVVHLEGMISELEKQWCERDGG